MRLTSLFESPQYSASCAICFDNRGNILLGKAVTDDDRNGLWCFPGGGVEPGEHPARAAERECYEETGFKAYAIQRPMGHRKKPRVAFVVCKLGGGIENMNQEFDELRWVPIGEAILLPDLYPVNREILRGVTSRR